MKTNTFFETKNMICNLKYYFWLKKSFLSTTKRKALDIYEITLLPGAY